jgi:hypothetical protein
MANDLQFPEAGKTLAQTSLGTLSGSFKIPKNTTKTVLMF